MEFKDNEIESVERDLPSLCLQLVLFINAGMVCSNAFDKIVELNRCNNRTIDILFRYIDYEAKNENISFENELYIVSYRIKSKILMRFSLLIIDNVSKGNELAFKIESEIEQLENTRLSNAKTKAKKAETLLCFPLMLLLISLILICISPAFMQI